MARRSPAGTTTPPRTAAGCWRRNSSAASSASCGRPCRTGPASSLSSRSSSVGRASTSPTWRCIRRRTCAKGWWRSGSPRQHSPRPGGADHPGSRLSGGPPVNARFSPLARLRGRIAPPADKSISHRAAIIAAMASEPVRITGYLDAADTRSTLDAVRELGAIVAARDGVLTIRGCGLRDAQPPADPIDVGNAGTLMRLLPGWLAFQRGHSFTLDGDESIRRRPRPDRRAAGGDGGDDRGPRRPFCPVTIHGSVLHGIEYELPVASAQVKSCLLLAGLVTARTTSSSRSPPVTTPSGCCCTPGTDPPREREARGGAAVGRPSGRSSATPTSSSSTRSSCRGPVERRLLIAAGIIDPWFAAGARGRGGQLDADRLSAHRRADGGIVIGDLEPPAAFATTSRSPISTSATARSRPPRSRPTRCRWPSMSCRSSRCSAASPRGDARARRR